MSKATKRSRKRKEREAQQKAEFMEWAREVAQDADEFLENATPFEISRSLSEMGVTTAHRDGIESIFKSIVEEVIKTDTSPPAIVRGLLKGLVDRWRSEISAKGRTEEEEDWVFLYQAAQHFALKWVTAQMRLQQESTAQEPGMTRRELADFYPFKKSETG